MTALAIPMRTAPRLGRAVTAIGWGAFKIGRNEGIKYPAPYDLPSEAESIALVGQIVALGISLIDTAPAYGLSESRLGLALQSLDAPTRARVLLSTKAGETFRDGLSTYDFSRAAIDQSVAGSLERLRTTHIDIVWVHSDGSDARILSDGEALSALDSLKSRGTIGAVGFSPKSVAGARAALSDSRVDAIMVEFHPEAQEMAAVVEEARGAGKAVFVKKPLASGLLDPRSTIPWILSHAGVTSLVVGGLSLERLRANAALAC